MPDLFRSLIFVPGNNPRFLAKARNLEADIVCLDLEDSVPGSRKAEAREMVVGALRSGGYRAPVFVRVNSPDSGMIPEDLETVLRGRPDGIVIPKADDAKDMDAVSAILERLERSPTLVLPSIESAVGVLNAYEIASHGPRVCAIVFGIFDLLNDMGMEYAKEPGTALYSRSKVPVDAAAAGVPAIDGIWQDIRDSAGFETDCLRGRSLGYAGKSLIHPDQIETAHYVFAPTEPEIRWARRVCEEYRGAAGGGRGAIQLDGRMIDEVHYKRALAVLELAD